MISTSIETPSVAMHSLGHLPEHLMGHSQGRLPEPSSAVRPLLRTANSHLVLIAEVLDTYGESEAVQMDVLSRLKTDLVVAMNRYRIAYQENEPLDVQLMKEFDLLWQCSHCDYYLSRRHGLPLLYPEPNRGLQQIRRIVVALGCLKLLTHIRQLMPGPNLLSMRWREILCGVRLWT